MVKPKPTGPMISAVCDGRQGLLSSIHHGLADVKMGGIYPYLDLEEALAFAISQYHDRYHRNDMWVSGTKDLDDFKAMVNDSSLYELFDHFFNLPIGAIRFHTNGEMSPYSWLRSAFNLDETQKEKWLKLNPFQGKDLKERLESVSEDVDELLRNNLRNQVGIYVFECEYEGRKTKRGSNHNLHIMHFQSKFPKKGKNVENYSREISKIIRKFPTHVAEYEVPTIETAVSEALVEQDLFSQNN